MSAGKRLLPAIFAFLPPLRHKKGEVPVLSPPRLIGELLLDVFGSALFHFRDAFVDAQLTGHDEAVLLVDDGLNLVDAFANRPLQRDGGRQQGSFLLFSSVGKPFADAITSATASLTYAGRVPVCAIAFAPSSEHIQETNFQASSLFALALLMAMPVGEPKEEPASTPSRCGTETMPQFMEAVPSLM